MAEGGLISNRWIYGMAYFGVMATLMLLHIMPTEIGPNGYPGPDLMLCITFAWVLRRPHFVPAPLIALVFLVGDMLFMRPPGLWAALVVIGAEILRAREATTREQTFGVEWAMVSGVILSLVIADRLIQAIFLLEQASFGLTLLGLIATLIAYPLIVLVSRYIFGVNRMTPSEASAVNRR